jgi:putative addiction module killer protein
LHAEPDSDLKFEAFGALMSLLDDSNLYVTIACDRRSRISRYKGRSRYAGWFDGLNAEAAAKVTTAVTRISLGNFSNVESVGSGVFEYKLDFGPGYRIYFGKDGETLVILLGGGTKKRQQHDIGAAIAVWQDYKRRK